MKTKTIGGNTMYRLFAYMHKRNHSDAGILEAASFADAKRHKGSAYHVRQTWLSLHEFTTLVGHSDAERELAHSLFLDPLSAAFVGH